MVPFDVINGAGTWNFIAGDPWQYYFVLSSMMNYWTGQISGSWAGNNFSETFATAPAAGHNAWVRWDSPNNPNLSNQTIPTTTIATLVTNGPVAPTVATTAGGGGDEGARTASQTSHRAIPGAGRLKVPAWPERTRRRFVRA